MHKFSAKSTEDEFHIDIRTEGKTDWKVLKKAQEKLNIDINLAYQEFESDMGDAKLLAKLRAYAEKPNQIPIVFIFDHDNRSIINEVNEPENEYKDWGNNIYSFSIPIPDHRKDRDIISLEFYFTDEEICTKCGEGRRLFLTSEFLEQSGKLISDAKISIGNKHVLKGCSNLATSRIVDTDVYNEHSVNIALSKSDFSTRLACDNPPFNNFNFDAFRRIFSIIERIYTATQLNRSIYVLDLVRFFQDVNASEEGLQFAMVLTKSLDFISMVLEIFIIAIIRYYEEAIVTEAGNKIKVARDIKKLLGEKFRDPSLKSLRELAGKCSHLMDSDAPPSLQRMNQALHEVFVLDDVGQMFDDLEVIFPTRGTPIKAKAKIRRDILSFVVPEFEKYTPKLADASESIKEIIDSGKSELAIEVWKNALLILINKLKPVLANPISLRSLKKVDTKTEEFEIEIRTYSEKGIKVAEEKIPVEQVEEYSNTISELKVSDHESIHLFPFLLIHNDALYFYRKTLANRYEYYSLVEDRFFYFRTKRKFNHSVFKIGSAQELFWTDVVPSKNDINGITANIPLAELDDFVGRRKQINAIMHEIIEIPNQNGIVYGPGGIGKTALMAKLSSELFDEKDPNRVIFDNIIWISAKSDFYDHIFDALETREPQFRTLDRILFAILMFFQFENLEEYGFEDRKELVLELLKEDKVLLVLDNFETVPESEVGKIIRFFDIETKRALRDKPGNFKVIITSRKQIPSGFHQIELRGLDLRESKILISNLYANYKHAGEELSEEQKVRLHEATMGIPIVIKHCFAKIYEYNKTLSAVIGTLPTYSSQIVQFSYREILDEIERRDKRTIQLQILILQELINYPLMARQISDILELEEHAVESEIPTLLSYQCLMRLHKRDQEKYVINDEMRLLSRALVQKHSELAKEIREKITRNYSIEKQMDFTSEEEGIVGIFENYLIENDYLEAEDFIKSKLSDNPESILLNYHYARYLKDRKREVNNAIDILETIRKPSGNHPSVLRLLFSCNLSLEIPNFDKASVFAEELEKKLGDNSDVLLELAMFYVNWSTEIKKGRGKDPLEEEVRRTRYKNLALKTISLLDMIHEKTHKVYFLYAQAYYNNWEYESAMKRIYRAIDLAEESGDRDAVRIYQGYRKFVQSRGDYYSRKPYYHS